MTLIRECEVRPIRCAELLDNVSAKGLLEAYAEECAVPVMGKPRPQRVVYEAMEAAGALVCLGAFVGDELVGFASVVIYLNPHYGEKLAMVESIYVAAGHRQLMGISLIAAVEECGRQARCAAVVLSAPRGSRFEKLLSLRKGCSQTNSIFAWRLK